MQFRVTIDRASPFANIHALAAQAFVRAAGADDPNDTHVDDKNGHPVLYCAGLDFGHPALLRAVVEIPADGTATVFWIPYSHILGILEVNQPSRSDNDHSEDDLTAGSGAPGEPQKLSSAQRCH